MKSEESKLSENQTLLQMVGIIRDMNDLVREKFENNADEHSRYFKLYNNLRDYESINDKGITDFENNRNLTKEIDELKDAMARVMANHKYKEIDEIEAYLEIGLFNEAKNKIEKLYSKLDEGDHFLKAHLFELKYKCLNTQDRVEILKNMPEFAILNVVAKKISDCNIELLNKIESVDTTFLNCIIKYQNNLEENYNKLALLKNNIEGLKNKIHNSNQSLFFEINDYVAFNQFVISFFEFLDIYMVKQDDLKPQDKTSFDMWIIQQYRTIDDLLPFSETALPNYFVLYSLMLRNELKLKIKLLDLNPTKNDNSEVKFINKIGIHFKPISTSFVILNILQNLLAYDKNIEHALNNNILNNCLDDCNKLLNKKQDDNVIQWLNEDTELAISALYVLLVKLLNEQSLKVVSRKEEAIRKIMKGGSYKERNAKVKNIDFFKHCIDFKYKGELIPESLIQQVMIKLRNEVLQSVDI